LKDEFGKEIGFGGGALKNLKTIDMSNINPLLKETEIVAISDVTNPLCGPRGASYIFGPKKGANNLMVIDLDKNLRHFGELIKTQLNKDIADIPGAGAAGGLGAGLMA